SIVLFLMEKESHELGLLFAYYLARNLGWKVYYLGQNVPHIDLLHVEEITSCNLFFTTVTIIRSNETIKALEQIADNLKTPLLVAGSQQILNAMESNKGIHVVSKPDDFSDFLESYRA
ncbi:MAG: cobalamin B12-binding domain-containing protein, partial [Bacteroidia bacterium]|nr:cobalamin B12-binding domain-containing protein [Bacteroidia bacterium]